MFGATITAMDGDEHRRYRALFQKAFAPTMLDEWKSVTVPRIVNTLIDKFESRGRADLVSEFALHFPFQFITELLALPVEDRPIFHKLAFAQTTVRYDPAHAGEAGEKLTSYLRELIAERLVDPPDPSDFIHTLAVAEIDGERLPEIVLISFLRQLMNAAGDTSYHGFSNLAAALLTHPDQLAAVRANRALIPQAVEEALRWEPPIVFIERSPSETTSLGGIELHPGDRMYIGIGAYNRDEAVFERPDEFDIYRPKQRHLVFGQGPHICIGQHLARAEMIVALNALLDRLPHLRIDPEAAYPHVYGVTLRKPKRVDVVFN
jgi:cytochrome P450